MKKTEVIVVIILMIILSACSSDKIDISVHKRQIEALENQITLSAEEVIKKEVEIERFQNKLNELTKEHTVELSEYEKHIVELNTVISNNEDEKVYLENQLAIARSKNEYYQMYEKLKSDVDDYYWDYESNSVRPHISIVNMSMVEVEGVKIYMELEEVISILGEDYTEEFFYDLHWGGFMRIIEYRNGLTLIFNPVCLVAINISDSGLSNNLGINIGDFTREDFSVLESDYSRFNNVPFLDNSSPENGDFYYDESSDIAVFISMDDYLFKYNDIDDYSEITNITIRAYRWIVLLWFN